MTLPRAGLLMLMACVVMVGGCSSPARQPAAPVDVQLNQLNRAGRAAFDAGQYELSARLYGQALERAYLRDDSSAAADAAYNAAAALSRHRAFDAAMDRLNEAGRNAADLPVDPAASIARLRLAILIEQARHDQADTLLTELLQQANRTAEAHRDLKLHQADLAIRRGDRAGADRLMAALGQMNSSDPARLMVQARYDRLRGDHAAAATMFEQAADVYRQRFHYAAMARALAEAAESTAASGDPAVAVDLWLRAARSARLQGFDTWDQQWRAKARAAAASTGDAQLLDRVQREQGDDGS